MTIDDDHYYLKEDFVYFILPHTYSGAIKIKHKEKKIRFGEINNGIEEIKEEFLTILNRFKKLKERCDENEISNI